MKSVQELVNEHEGIQLMLSILQNVAKKIASGKNVPKKERHRVSLVRNTTVADPNDGYIHLEYRYNTYNDLSGYWLEGAVSFNLNSLEMGENTKGIKVKLNSQKNGEVELTFDLNSTQTPASVKSMKLSGALSDKLK